MKKLFIEGFLCLVTLSLAVGCSKNDDREKEKEEQKYNISVDINSHTFDNDMNLQQTFVVTADTPWSVSGIDSDSWLEAFPMQGDKGTTTLILKTKSLNDSYFKRKLSFKIAADNVNNTPYISIFQSGYQQMELPCLLVVKAGTLDQALSAVTGTATSALSDVPVEQLFIHGEINRKDLQVLNNLKNLKHLSLREATIENNTIPQKAFYLNETINTMAFPYSLKSIEDEAFRESKISNVDLYGTSIETIGSYSFYKCKKLTEHLYLPKTVKEVGAYAFSLCEIKGVSFGGVYESKLIKIGMHAFEYNEKMVNDLYIPDKVEVIGSYAFQGCGYNNYLYLGKSLREIGVLAFSLIGVSGNSGFKIIECSAVTPPSTSSSQKIFRNDQKNILWAPSGSINAYKSSEAWSGFKKYEPI